MSVNLSIEKVVESVSPRKKRQLIITHSDLTNFRNKNTVDMIQVRRCDRQVLVRERIANPYDS